MNSFKRSFISTDRVITAFGLVTILWLGVIFSAETLRIGDGWVDYLVVKGLSVQLFEAGTGGVSQWHPFVLPPLLFSLSGYFVPQGPDYLLAHSILWISYFLFLIKPVRSRLTPIQAALFLGSSFIFINFPGAPWLGFSETNQLCYAIFYNRYLDVIWGGVFLLYFYDDEDIGLADLALVGYILIIAYFSKLSYFAGYSLVFFFMSFSPRWRGLWGVMTCVAALGLLYEPFGHLLQNNFDLLLARSDERGMGGVLKGRMLIPGLVLPIFLAFTAKTPRKYTLGMTFLALLVSLMHLGNHNDLGAVPFALLLMIIFFRFHGPLREGLLVYWHKRRIVASFVGACSIYLLVVGLLISGAKCIHAAYGVVADLAGQGERRSLKGIPGFFMDAERLARFSDKEAVLPGDIKAYQTGEQISKLIEYIKVNQDKRYFVNIYPSVFPLLSANLLPPNSARAWIAPYEFRDKGVSYLKQQRSLADYEIISDCSRPPSIPNTCYVILNAGAGLVRKPTS